MLANPTLQSLGRYAVCTIIPAKSKKVSYCREFVRFRIEFCHVAGQVANADSM
jgi:hypothetical protein